MISHCDISLGILAGGEASRLGGQDKGLIECGGKSLIHHVQASTHATIAPKLARVLLSANRNIAEYKSMGFEPFADLREGYQGPLAGIESLLHRCTTPWLWLMPVDAIATPVELLARLIKAQEVEGDLAMAVRVNGRENPVCALLHRSLRASVSNALDADQRSVMRWIENDVKWVDFHQEENQWIWSVNTPQQLAQAERQLSRLAN